MFSKVIMKRSIKKGYRYNSILNMTPIPNPNSNPNPNNTELIYWGLFATGWICFDLLRRNRNKREYKNKSYKRD